MNVSNIFVTNVIKNSNHEKHKISAYEGCKVTNAIIINREQ